ncbi:unnamed protein product [Lota lota]
MDRRPNPVGYVSSSPAGDFVRPVHRPPPSPCPPHVPDITGVNTGLEWFEMSACPGTSSSDQAVPSSPFLTASQSSPRCHFSVPSTPVQETWELFLHQEDEPSPASTRTLSPLGQTVPDIGERRDFVRKGEKWA